MFVMSRDEYGQKRAENIMKADAIMQEGSGVYAYWKVAQIGEDLKEQLFYSETNNIEEATKAFDAIMEVVGIHQYIGGRNGSRFVSPDIVEDLKVKGIEIVNGELKKLSEPQVDDTEDTESTEDVPDADLGADLETVGGTDDRPHSLMDNPEKRPQIEAVAQMRNEGTTWKEICEVLGIGETTARNYNDIYHTWLSEGGDDNGNSTGTDRANEAQAG